MFLHNLKKTPKVCDHMKKHNQVVFYTIQMKGSTIKSFLILDCIAGMGIYYLIKWISTSVLIGVIGSIVGTHGIKKVSVKYPLTRIK